MKHLLHFINHVFGKVGVHGFVLFPVLFDPKDALTRILVTAALSIGQRRFPPRTLKQLLRYLPLRSQLPDFLKLNKRNFQYI
jgi:hypothetical protein